MANVWGWVKGIFSSGKVVEKGMDLADEAFHTDQEKAEQDSKDTATAANIPMASHDSWFDILVDGMNRLVRPAFAFWSFGVLVGWWGEKIKDISPEAMNIILLVVTFFFGGRAILKDLPSVIKSLRAK